RTGDDPPTAREDPLGGRLHSRAVAGESLCAGARARRFSPADGASSELDAPASPSGKPKRLTVEVETAGIEPASAVAEEMASTSVSGALNLAPYSPRRPGCREPAP